jgi:prepilin-type N-terminal cleavage/methylation domain-containing protein
VSQTMSQTACQTMCQAVSPTNTSLSASQAANSNTVHVLTRSQAPVGRRGFSLIEVLISVTVLALALLGLAAVFPAVVKQQQRTSDAVQGDSVARSAFEALSGYQSMVRPSPSNVVKEEASTTTGAIVVESVDSSLRQTLRGWHQALSEGLAGTTGKATWSIYPPKADRGERLPEAFGQWELPDLLPARTPPTTPFAMDSSTGELWVGVPSTKPAGTSTNDNSWQAHTQIGVKDRLFPKPLSADGEPRYVWDLAARRVYAGKRDKDGKLIESVLRDSVEVAVFVRRLDSGIRLKGVSSLAEAFGRAEKITGDRYVPVAQSAEGEPTNDGRGNDAGGAARYSRIWKVSLPVGKITTPSGGGTSGTTSVLTDRLYLGSGAKIVEGASIKNPSKYVAQVGQKLLGYSGTVHTVVKVIRRDELDEEGGVAGLPELASDGAAPAAVILDPPLSIERRLEPSTELPKVLDFLMTPQVPASVLIKRMTPRFQEDFSKLTLPGSTPS